MASDSLLKVLVVDDEPFIRKGLAALIDWEAEGFIIAGEASNGETAIELLKTNHYDLIISDIKMPQMDGIEFVRYVKDNKLSDARFIFLSGYYDFCYAKTAIQYGCCDYILKPIQSQELLATIRRIMNDYRKEAEKNKDKRNDAKAYLDHHLMAVLWGKCDSVDIEYVQDKLKHSGKMAYVLCEISQSDESFASLTTEKKREQQRRLYYYASLLLKEYSDYIVYEIIKLEHCYDMGIIYCENMSEEKGMSSDEWIKWLQKELTERIGYKVLAFMGCIVSNVAMLADSYREAVMLRSLDIIKKYRGSRSSRGQSSKITADDVIRKHMDELVHVIEINDRPKLREEAKAVYKSLMDKNMDPGMVIKYIQYLIYKLLGLAYKQDTDIDQEEIMQYIKETVFAAKNGSENCMRFQQFIEEYSDYLMQVRQNKSKGIIELIEAEIENNYPDNISLKQLAEKYYFNSAYLGQLFKKRYGCSFKDYLNNLRIRKAAEMLLHTDKKIYEVAVETGYKNMEYFVNRFEEVYGTTPTGFRKRHTESKNIINKK